MIRNLRAGLAFAAALLLAAGHVSAAPQSVAAPAASRLAVGQWPQDRSDLRPDPAIRFGALPNGMRYALRKQSIPPGQAALRLWIGAGSLHETDAQQGLAHFLEHMAFNGSKGVKEGEMVKILERLGLSFGADTNASTSFSETIYKLDLPNTDAETVDTSLMLLREAASNLLIEPAAVDRERGVLLSEERARDTPAYRVVKERLAFLLEGQRLPTRMPIGQAEVLRSAPAAEIADFYRKYYRPERAVLVAVGDFDLDAMEAKIRAGFGDWAGAGPSGGKPDPGRVKRRGAEARLVVEPGVQPSLQIAWTRPHQDEPDTVARRRRELIENLGLAVLNRRYSRIARAPSPPFLGAWAYEYEQEDAAEIAMVAVNAEPGRWREALTAAEQEQRRLVRYGVRQDELDREIEEVRANLKAAAAGAATRRQADLAEEIVGFLSDDLVVTSPADNLARFEAVVAGLKADTVSAALKTVFQGSGPLVFLASPAPVEGGEKTVLAALAASRAVAVAPPAAAAEIAWPYEDFGPAGKVAETREIADLGVTLVRFENGVRLTVKPTAFRDDEVLVRVNVGEGMLALPSDRQSQAWASSAYIEGGLKKIELEDMERVLASKVYGARFGIGEDAFILTGGTRTEHLPTQLQVLAAYLAEPGWRAAAFERVKAAGKTIHDRYEATDSGVLSRDLRGLLRTGDRRWTFPSREEIASARLEDLTSEVMPHLVDGPVEVVIVGDVTVDQAVEQVARTFGALPPRPEPQPVPAGQRQVRFPAGAPEPVVLTHKGRPDQSIGYVAWPTDDYWADPQRARDTAILGEVLRLRLLDELRESQGATYSPGVDFTHSLVWTGWGYIAASVEVPPEKLDAFFDDVAKIAADLRAEGISEDELARAKKPRIERIQKARVTNQYWLSELAGAQWEPRRLDIVRQAIPATQRVTAADVKRAAETFLKAERAWKLVVKPQSAQAALSSSP